MWEYPQRILVSPYIGSRWFRLDKVIPPEGGELFKPLVFTSERKIELLFRIFYIVSLPVK